MFYHWIYWQATAIGEISEHGGDKDMASFYFRLLLYKRNQRR